MEKQYFKILKIDEVGRTSLENKKFDYCIVEANTSQEAYNYLLDRLNKRKTITCQHFTSDSTYEQNINNIADFIPSSKKEFESFKQKCLYAMEKSKKKSTTV